MVGGVDSKGTGKATYFERPVVGEGTRENIGLKRDVDRAEAADVIAYACKKEGVATECIAPFVKMDAPEVIWRFFRLFPKFRASLAVFNIVGDNS